MESNQVVMAARLQSLETKEELCVVTTHLKVIINIIVLMAQTGAKGVAICV